VLKFTVQSVKKFTWFRSTRLVSVEEVAFKQQLTSMVRTLVLLFPISSLRGTKTWLRCLQKFTFSSLRSPVSKLLAKEAQSIITLRLSARTTSLLSPKKRKRSIIIDSAYNQPKMKKCLQVRKETTPMKGMLILKFYQ
jgi:hypothetical protein